ncbi:MAG: ATP-binding protein [Desulfovibrionales bacterium]|nr:MAG: ATP-binding protein [Desulfovibrionales bacterium]
MVNASNSSSAPTCTSCPSRRKGGLDGRSAANTAQDRLIKSTLDNIRFKLFVMSGKGGVGKSSIAVNLAAALALNGYRVGLLDVDIHGPSIPHLLGLSGTLDKSRGSLIAPKQYGERLFVVSMESLLKDPDQAVLWRGPMKTAAIRQFIADVDWGHLDFLVVDSPPGTGDEPMTVLKTIPEALSIVVTTPQEISLADVRKSINFLQYAHANILGLVENMSGLICPHCTQRIELFKTGGGKALAEKYGLDFLGAVPLDPAAVVAGDLGRPVVMLEEETPAKQALLQLANRVVQASENSLEATARAMDLEEGPQT